MLLLPWPVPTLSQPTWRWQADSCFLLDTVAPVSKSHPHILHSWQPAQRHNSHSVSSRGLLLVALHPEKPWDWTEAEASQGHALPSACPLPHPAPSSPILLRVPSCKVLHTLSLGKPNPDTTHKKQVIVSYQRVQSWRNCFTICQWGHLDIYNGICGPFKISN